VWVMDGNMKIRRPTCRSPFKREPQATLAKGGTQEVGCTNMPGKGTDWCPECTARFSKAAAAAEGEAPPTKLIWAKLSAPPADVGEDEQPEPPAKS
jgi:hypothetical protein